ncbi:MAG: VTT domain-containing protein [Lentisphaeria bacterium]|nr:VTT domain-containing protein [Lentisphaeria bacterium]
MAGYFDLPWLTEPLKKLEAINGDTASPLIGLVIIALLVVDVLLPVASSPLMMASGFFYSFPVASLINLVGCIAAAMTAYYIGRFCSPLMNKLVTVVERDKAERCLNNWGMMAIVLSRPIPVLAETVAILAGYSKMPIKKMLLASVLGNIPHALMYAYAGKKAVEDKAITIYVFIAVIAITGVLWLIGKIFTKKKSAETVEKE